MILHPVKTRDTCDRIYFIAITSKKNNEARDECCESFMDLLSGNRLFQRKLATSSIHQQETVII